MVKWIGAFLGFAGLGLPGAFLGYFIGSIIDRMMSLGMGAVNPLSAKSRQESFLKTAFLLMGKLAKADGHISKSEVDSVEAFMSQLSMTADHRKQAIGFFKQGSSDNFDIKPCLDEFKLHCGQTKNLNQALLTYLIVLALADGVLDRNEEALLISIAQELGFSEAEFAQLMSMIGAQDQFGGGATTQGSIDKAYQALGVTESDSDKDIKRAYRKLMSKYHPDKLMGQGLPEDMIKDATERSQEIRSAYDLIKKQRAN